MDPRCLEDQVWHNRIPDAATNILNRRIHHLQTSIGAGWHWKELLVLFPQYWGLTVGVFMERFFVRILNVTLLVAGFITLAATLAATIFLSIEGYALFSTKANDEPVVISYQPLSTLAAQETTQPSGPSGAITDQPLEEAAKSVCAAKDKIVRLLSNSSFSMDAARCVSTYTSLDSPDRDIDKLKQMARYLDAARVDPQLPTKYPPTADKNAVSGYLTEIEDAFDAAFERASEQRNQQNGKILAQAAESKGRAVVWATSAVSAFGAFLLIAFLIVAIRIEKHLANVERKLPEPA